MRGWVWGLLFMKQTLSDKFFNWFGFIKELFPDIFNRDDDFDENETFYEKYWWIPDVISLIALVVAIASHFSR